MSKRIYAVLLALSILATSNAFASRARVLVHGTGDAGSVLGTSGNRGSFFVDDAYNIFYNPSYVNDFKNWATIEKSNFPAGTAQGGFVTNLMNFNVGVYMNRIGAYDSTIAGTARGNNAAGASQLANYRPIDLIVGGDMGVKWGLGLTYGSFERANTSAPNLTTNGYTGKDITLRAGIQIADLEPFVQYKLNGKQNNTGDNQTINEAEAKDITLGARYHYGEWIPYAAFTQRKFNDGATPTGGTKTSPRETNWGVGLGRNAKVSDAVKLDYAISYFRNSRKNAVTGAVTYDSVQSIIPVDVSVEADAASWLAIRAGLGYRLLDRISAPTGSGLTPGSQADSTTGRIGATFKFGKLDMDWVVGNQSNVSAGNTETAGAADAQTFGVGHDMFTAAALTYTW